jgi:hypothetical protein
MPRRTDTLLLARPAPIMEEGKYIETEEGTPQGGY